MEKVLAKRKPHKCPSCGSFKIASIQYGHPIYSEKMQKDLEEGKIVLGGCCVTNEDPVWQCVDCNTRIYKQLDRYISEDF